MTMRKFIAGASLLALAAGAALPASAETTWTGTIAVTSDYKFRGISQTDNDPAIQGSFEAAHGGFFAGAWASTIDFGVLDPGADVEIDLYVGYTHALTEDTSLTGKVVYYWYPGATTNDASFVEVIGALEHNFGKFSGNVQVAYTPDYYGGTDSATWVAIGGELPVNDWLSVSANVGHQWFENNFGAAPNVDLPDYTHADIGVTATWDIAALDVRYVYADLDKGDCFFNATGGLDTCDSKFVVTLTLTNGSGE
jgi:uncharacterized protein (TIGR02001 family)